MSKLDPTTARPHGALPSPDGEGTATPQPHAAPRAPTLRDALERALSVSLASDLAQTARHLGVSKRSIQRALARDGLAFHDLRNRLRLNHAETILLTSDTKMRAIADEVGFASTAHFSAWFRRHRGHTPAAWRERELAARAAHRSHLDTSGDKTTHRERRSVNMP